MQFAIIVAHFVLFAVCICTVESRRRKWSKWSKCDTHIATCPCGEGTQERTRRCRRRDRCSGLEKEVKDCYINDCKCEYYCNVRLQDRVQCGPANKTKEECPKDEFCCFDEIMKTCYKAIPRLVQEVIWEWTSWSKCDCFRNFQTRTRECKNTYGNRFNGDLKIQKELQDTKTEKVSSKTNWLGQGIKKKVGEWYHYLNSLYRRKSRDIELIKNDEENELNIDKRGWGWGWLRITETVCEPIAEKRLCNATESCKNGRRQGIIKSVNGRFAA